MLPVDLNTDPNLGTEEIQNVGRKRVLPAEAEANFLALKSEPEGFLQDRHLLPKLTCPLDPYFSLPHTSPPPFDFRQTSRCR